MQRPNATFKKALLYILFFFAAPKKETKNGAPEKIQPFPGWSPDLAFVLL